MRRRLLTVTADEHYANRGREMDMGGGTNVANSAGVYGTKGVASASNVPSARGGASSWIDASGNRRKLRWLEPHLANRELTTTARMG